MYFSDLFDHSDHSSSLIVDRSVQEIIKFYIGINYMYSTLAVSCLRANSRSGMFFVREKIFVQDPDR